VATPLGRIRRMLTRASPSLHLLIAAALAAPAIALAEPTAQASSGRLSEPRVERIVQEDDNVRIDELRVRGVTQTISVHSKAAGGVSRYQIRTGDGSDAARERGGAGRSVWQLLAF
jgi:hypothetical protein